jgi:glyoxylase-like metal-dependent hydrolase (beta-lactamase superfamily II)
LNYEEQLTSRITEDVIAINDLHSSMYFVRTNDGYIAIDAGFFSGIIEKGFEYNDIRPESIRAVLLTHTDLDHQNAISIFHNATVYLSFNEFYMVKDGINRLSFIPWFTNTLKFNKYLVMKDEDEFTIGNRKIKCIALPGHTLGSMGYIIDGKYLFSGDAFRIKNGKLQLPYKRIFAMDINQMENTLRKVAQLKGIKYIFSGHSGFTADFNYAVSDWKSN